MTVGQIPGRVPLHQEFQARSVPLSGTDDTPAQCGVPVKDPLGIGEAGTQQTCTLLRATDEFPGISFTLKPGGTIAGQIEFVKTNFQIDIVPLEGAEGFYAGEGDSVYWESNGNPYQTSATIDGDSRIAALNLMKAWQGL